MRYAMAFLALGLLCLHCAAGQNAYVNYGLPDTGSPYISGIIFNDANGNGIKDDKETGIYGWIVKLISPDKTVVNALTAQNGSYIFSNLEPGTYLVDENMPAEWIQTLPSDECYSVSVSDRDVTSVNFGNAFVGSMNNPPAAPSIPSGPVSGYTGSTYAYTSTTTDPDDDTVKYIFNWGDGSKTMTGLLTSGEVATGSHTWTSEGVYNVTVDAIDGKGTASASSEALQVTIELTPNTAPSVPTLTSDKTSAIEGDSISFTAASSDPESNTISYVFDWDDGTKTMTDPAESGIAVTMTHAWSGAGSRNVKVNATDSLGASSEESEPLLVTIDANTAPDVPALTSDKTLAYIDSPVSFTATSSDPNSDSIRYVFDWGDGTKTMTEAMASGTPATMTHAWSSEGSNSVTVNATDSRGASSAESTPISIDVIYNLAPSVPTLTSDKTSAITGDSISFTATSSDPESDTIIYVFDWGDGTKTMASSVASGTAVTKAHAWSSAGSNSVTVNATDSKGESSAESAPISITINANNAPVVPTLTSDKTSAYIGQSVSFTATSSDPESDTIRYVFDWGDGTKTMTSSVASGTPATKTHAWSSAGSKSVKVNATDSKGSSSAESTPISITITANSAPVVPTLTSNKTSAYIGSPISFTATSSDPNSDSIRYVFTWGDGTKTMTESLASGTSATRTHTWSSGGSKSVTVNATDSRGASSAQSTAISINVISNLAPSVPTVTSSKTSAITGDSISFTATSSDPESDTIKYVFDWGDGTKTMTSSVASGTPATKTHAWSSAGSKSVKVNATDSKGASSAESAPISITINANSAPVVPTLTSNKTSAYIGSPISFTATSSDPNSDSIRYVFTWGDGTKTMTESLASGTAATRTHKWSSAGTKSVTANATDSRGGSSAQSTAISVAITVAPTNSAPATPTLSSATSSGTVETIYTFTAMTQDPEGDQLKYTFDWGDGQTSTTGLVDSGTSQSASHAWAGEKTYNVKVNAIDSKGASSAWSGSKAVAITVPSLVPGKATLISPTGSISTHTPTFEWNPVKGSTSYTLNIKNGFNTNILQKTYSAQETASGTIRKVTPPQDLAPGQYTWNIKTYNEKRSGGTLSSSTSFTVL